jgi:hypothetical protein
VSTNCMHAFSSGEFFLLSMSCLLPGDSSRVLFKTDHTAPDASVKRRQSGSQRVVLVRIVFGLGEERQSEARGL